MIDTHDWAIADHGHRLASPQLGITVVPTISLQGEKP
jgi:hypothetical protein